MTDPSTKAREILDIVSAHFHEHSGSCGCESTIAAALREYGTEAIRNSVNTFSLTKQEVDRVFGEGYRRGRSENTELFVLEVNCEFGKDCIGKGCSGASHYLTYDEIYRRGILEAAEIADEHNGCTDVKCLSESNCGATIANQLRALLPSEGKGEKHE